jgi:methyl-accepting chemotaxis protein
MNLRFSHWSFTAKMAASIAALAMIFAVFAVSSTLTRQKVQVGGPYYARIILGKDLVADILPPPAYIIEAYLLTYQIANSVDQKEREALLARWAETEKEFQTRQKVWQESLPASRMKDALVVDSAKSADEFFKLGHERFVPAVQKGDLEAALKLANQELRLAYTAHRKFIDEVVILANKFGEEQEKQATHEVKRSAAAETLLGAVGLAFGVGMAFWIVRRLARELRGVAGTLNAGSAQTVAAAAQISHSSQILAEGASEQAAALEQSSASLGKISGMTERTHENAQRVQDSVNQARHSADTGAGQMQAMQDSMRGIHAASEDITKILRTIDEIAFQTNILALNAAVEAARAGEAGAGFAVVADEVRALAQRCARAAKETAEKVDASVAKSRQGVEASTTAARHFEEIQGRVRQLEGLVKEIAAATQEQTQGIGQVTQAVAQMDQFTQRNAATAEETSAAAEQLNSQSLVLKQTVLQLRQLTDGIGAVAREPIAEVAASNPRRLHPAPRTRASRLRAEQPIRV